MARYIDADKLKEECYYYDTEEDLERYVIKHGYADVVPKSEVDYWKQQTFNACMNNGYLDPKIITHLLENADGHDDPTGEKGTDGLEAAISYAKSELASGILMDIKAIMQIIILNYKEIGAFDNAEIVGYVRDHLIAELEKRYTEGEDKPTASEEKYFSPEDVRKMINQEVREKYTAIHRSMERW